MLQLSVVVLQPGNFSPCFLANPAYFVFDRLETQYQMLVETQDRDVPHELGATNPSYPDIETRNLCDEH